MNMMDTYIVYFSPTNTTKTVLKSIVKGIGTDIVTELDLSKGLKGIREIADSLVIVGVPVYSGRIPVLASEQLMKILGKNSKVVLVAVYGNRHYDDTLVELQDITEGNGFETIAAAAFIGEHSFSTDIFPIALNRPDTADLQKAEQFGLQIEKMIAKGAVFSCKIPGNRPYKELPKYPGVAPVTNEDKCDMCGICVDVCPTDAIHINGEVSTDGFACIKCCACVKECPNNARYNDNEMINVAAQKLFNLCSERKEPEIFV
ncbi:4Fe-4S binding protein [Plebeiibacterium marinum]|uniref:4Fe-4S binding protein n=1 Tax=Plebeiibacterium marinum TaxID=2992111 RepID=A0AAE3SLI5_9BACT|nr:4Fe-4S binding protein [Plebeiobacterium marinum]MCW3806605.1 4Fe-4S binding protein [Plebeiobacterium marinum]